MELDLKWLFEEWSKSKLKNGENCVYSLVLQSLGVEQPPNIFAEVGHEIHNFLELFAKHNLHQPLNESQFDELIKIKNHPTIENFVLLEKERVRNVGGVYIDAEHYIEVELDVERLKEMDESWEELVREVKNITTFQIEKVVLKGYIDRVDKVGEDVVLVEYKTGSLEYVSMDEMWFYALLWWLKYNQIPKFIVLYGLKEGKMKWDRVEEERLISYFSQTLCRIRLVIEKLLDFFRKGIEKDERSCKRCWWREVCDI